MSALEDRKRLTAIRRRVTPKRRSTQAAVLGTVDVRIEDIEWLLEMAQRAVDSGTTRGPEDPRP